MSQPIYLVVLRIKIIGLAYTGIFPVNEIRASVGAGFLYALAGRIETLPGLPTRPRALDMDITSEGEVVGLS